MVDFPSTFTRMSKLEVLLVDENHINSLPIDFVFPTLLHFAATFNSIESLPVSLSECKALEVLHMKGNPLQPAFWSIVADLPKLRDLSPMTPYEGR